MSRPSVTLYIDVVSPFAYIAFHVLRNDPVFASCDIKYIPIFLGGIMRATGNRPPITIKNKDKWIGLERERWARYFNVPIIETVPEGFPPFTLTVMRALAVVDVLEKDQKKLIKAFEAAFQAFWVEGRNIVDPLVLKEVLEKTLGADLTRKVNEMIPKEGKDALLANTDKALEDGAFGLPWFTCTDREGKVEGFWGIDHLGQVAQFLGLETPESGGWKALL